MNNKKEQARRLWDICFNDMPQFTELYFNKRYTDNNTVAIYEEQRMLTVMQLLSYPFHAFNQTIPSGYVSGACTDPDARNRGLMSQLLALALEKLYVENTPICTLIPAHDWLFDYYGKSGFSTLFYNSVTTNKCTASSNSSSFELVIEDSYSTLAHDFLNKKLKEKGCAILHSKEDYDVILADLRLACGKVFLALKDSIVKGIAIAYYSKEENRFYLNELLADNDEVKQFLLSTAASKFNSKEYSIIEGATQTNGNPFGMLRIVNAQTILELYSKENKAYEDSFYLVDSIIEENQGFYQIKSGKVKFEKATENIDKLKEVTINSLASTLFENKSPYMSLMLD